MAAVVTAAAAAAAAGTGYFWRESAIMAGKGVTAMRRVVERNGSASDAAVVCPLSYYFMSRLFKIREHSIGRIAYLVGTGHYID